VAQRSDQVSCIFAIRPNLSPVAISHAIEPDRNVLLLLLLLLR
jgi:hypothetical protein